MMSCLTTAVFCVFAAKRLVKKHADKPGLIPRLHLHLSGFGTLDKDPKTDELMGSCEAAFVSTVKLHLLEHQS